MGHRLTTAIRIAETSRAILRKIRTFPDGEAVSYDGPNDLADMGVEPMLLALSMELALKAWFVFDFEDDAVVRSHDLMKLFEALRPESQERLDQEFKRTVAPAHPSMFYVDFGIGHVLSQHRDAFIDWRYMYEPKTTSFDSSTFQATLELVLTEFGKRYATLPAAPTLGRW